MKKLRLLCVFLAAALLGACAACAEGPVAEQTGTIPDITKGYFAGDVDASTATVDLAYYVNANGTRVGYRVTSEHPEVASAEVSGNLLYLTLESGEGSSRIFVEVSSNDRVAFTLSFTLTATVYERVACVGDSLTYGHTWHNQSYPVYLQELLGEDIEVQNFGVNGSAVTNRSESNYTLKYDTLQEYRDSVAFEPDVVLLMLGSNDGYNWTGSQPTFEEEYVKLLNGYLGLGAHVIVLTAPPTLEGNAFNMSDEIIRENVCPLQRSLATDFRLPLVDVRKAFEARQDMESLYRPGDGVHFSVEGAQFVAGLAADAVKKL